MMIHSNEFSNVSQIEQKRLSLEKTLFSVNDLIKGLHKLGNLSFIKDNIEFQVVNALSPSPSSTSTPILSRMSRHPDSEEILVTDVSAYIVKPRGHSAHDEASMSGDLGGKDGCDLVVIRDEGELRGILICLLSNVSKPIPVHSPDIIPKLISVIGF